MNGPDCEWRLIGVNQEQYSLPLIFIATDG